MGTGVTPTLSHFLIMILKMLWWPFYNWNTLNIGLPSTISKILHILQVKTTNSCVRYLCCKRRQFWDTVYEAWIRPKIQKSNYEHLFTKFIFLKNHRCSKHICTEVLLKVDRDWHILCKMATPHQSSYSILSYSQKLNFHQVKMSFNIWKGINQYFRLQLFLKNETNK